LKSKYEGKVAKGKIKEFILDYASDLNESKQSKSELEDYIDKMESKIWEIQNSNKSWIPNTQSKKDAMIKTFQSKIDKAKKDLEKLK
jgi:peptidoglycan hydrolase CwlO-like protein